MGKMGTCPCGFVVISPQGEADVIKHVAFHLQNHHPGIELTDEEMRKKVLNL